MKKITSILMLFVLACAGAWAQNITTATYGNGNGTFYNAAGNVITSGFDGKKFVSNTTPAVTIESSYTGGLNAGDAVNGARIGTDNTANNTDGVTTYTISVPDGYEITEYSLACWAVNGGHPAKTLTDGKGATYDVSSTSQKTVSCTDINAQTTNFKLTTTVQAWSPIRTNNFVIKVKKVKFNLVYKCYMEGETEPFETVTSTEMYNDGEVTITDAMVPEFTGKAMTSHDASVTINGADAEVNVYYAAASINYSVVLKDMPDGTNVTIGGTTVANGDTYQSIGAVSESDVAVTFPAEIQEFMTYSVDISGTSITVYFEDSRVVTNIIYSINTGTFSSNNNWTNGWTSTATNPFVKLTVPANNIQRSTGDIYSGAGGTTYTLTAQQGYVITGYTIVGTSKGGVQTLTPAAGGSAVAFNTDQQYTLNVRNLSVNSTSFAQSTPNNGIAISSFVIKVKQDPNYVPVTYVITEGGETIYTSDPVLTALGTTVTELPDDLKRSAWYDYDPISVNVTAETTTITVAATAKENQPVKYTEDTTSPYYYNMNIRSQYLVFDETNEDKVKLQATSEPFNPNASWAFIGNPYDGFRVINQTHGASNVLTYTTVSMSRPTTHNIQFQTGAEAEAKTWLIDTNTGGIVLRMKENQNIYFHHENGNSGKYLRTCSNSEWSSVHNDAGSTIVVTTDKDVLVQLYNVLNEKKDLLGEGLGKYSVSGMTADEFQTLLDDVKSDLDNDVTSDFLSDYNALLAVTFTINPPQAGTFLRFTSVHNTYLSGVESEAEAGRLSFTDNANANTIFYFDGNKLLTFGNGFYANGRNASGASGTGLNYWFEESSVTAGKYAIRFNPDGEEDRWLYAYDTTKNYADQNKSDAANCAFTIEEVTELPLKLKAYEGQYYATFSAPVDIAEISGATIYKLEIQSEKYAKYVDAEATSVPANVGVLLIGPSATATATIGESTSGLTVADTNLHPQLPCEKGAGSATKLYLGKSGGKLGFYKMQEWTEEKPYVTNGFKAYFVPTEPVSGAKEGFELVGDEVTGIETIDNGLTIDNGAVYNLQGQKVTKAQKGVFIVNGKKVVVK